MEDHNGKSTFGLEENIVASAAYFLLGPILYIKEKQSDFVRFHALQSTLGYALLIIFWLFVRFVPALWFLKFAPGIG